MANKPVTQKRDRSKRKRIQLQVDDIDLPMIPAQLTIANLLPKKIEMPKWQGTDEAEFARFFDEHFPPEDERFAAFRHQVEGPNMMPHSAPRSKIYNYLKIRLIREWWWQAARINRMTALMTNSDPGPLRICEWTHENQWGPKLFIANRNNQEWCTEKCGAAHRQKQKRDRQKKYELNRELNISKKNNVISMSMNDRNRKKKKKGASR